MAFVNINVMTSIDIPLATATLWAAIIVREPIWRHMMIAGIMSNILL